MAVMTSTRSVGKFIDMLLPGCLKSGQTGYDTLFPTDIESPCFKHNRPGVLKDLVTVHKVALETLVNATAVTTVGSEAWGSGSKCFVSHRSSYGHR